MPDHLPSQGDATTEASGSGATAPSPQTAGKTPIRIFTCAGHECRDRQGGKPLIEALRREITATAGKDAPMDVMACPCLDHCKKGPVVVAYRGKAAQSGRPPHGMGKLLYRPLATFFRVTPADARRLIDALRNK